VVAVIAEAPAGRPSGVPVGGPPAFVRRVFEGALVRVEPDGSWSFYRCARCRRPLRDPESVKRGYGPECRRQLGDEELVALRELVRSRDRARYRRFLEVEEVRRRSEEAGRFEDDGTGVDRYGRVMRGWR
jgi:hypothetical protein